MKKSLFFAAAASALMLTACSSENDVVQSPTNQNTVAVQQQAVGFDVYTQQSTGVTRAGLEGTMTTTRMQRSAADGGGFGVYAFLTEDTDGAGGEANATSYQPANLAADPFVANVPNFMVNEKILWNSQNLGWYYNPLKYWPNETDKDSQSTPASMQSDAQGGDPAADNDRHLDRLTFFAYAPYVSDNDDSGTGITYITGNDGLMNSTKIKNPSITWKACSDPTTDFDPNKGVDLLWGVAPSGGLEYTAVNGWTVTRKEGTPLINMIKPDVNTSMKFLFQHALARFGINVVAAIDQVSPGGELDPNTKITIESLKITGPFGTTGVLDLNNGEKASVANWTTIGTVGVTTGTTDIPATNGTIVVTANATNDAIAENLRWKKDDNNSHTNPLAQTVVGVTPAKQDLLAPSTKWINKLASAPTYTPAKKYVDVNGDEVHASYTFDDKSLFYTVDAGQYTQKSSGTESSPNFPAIATTNTYYMLTETGAYVDQASKPASLANDTKMYTRSGAGTDLNPYVYTYSGLANAVTWNGTNDFYTVEGTKALASDIPFTYSGDIYEAERNYLYVVPTNAALDKNFGGVTSSNEAKLRTITVQIEYYISTEDSKLAKQRTETKNVITKEVVLPSLANGKSYMLNLVLGLTSVKIEAEVDDWKVVNVNADLPQNTSN